MFQKTYGGYATGTPDDLFSLKKNTLHDLATHFTSESDANYPLREEFAIHLETVSLVHFTDTPQFDFEFFESKSVRVKK